MATIPTQNAVPSEAPRDLKFNSGKIDEFVTSLEHEYKDRFGRCHMTIEGMKWMFDQLVLRFKVDMNQAIISAGYITVDSFQQGAQLPNNEITQRNQILRDETTGEYYRWDGDLPKVVTAGSTPESTGGIGKGGWIDIGGANLRTDLKADNGFTFVGGLTENYLRVFDNVAEMVAETSLPLGATVKTRGYYSPGDGGEGIYTITNNQPDTLVNVILDNGLTATLDVTSGVDILSVGAQANADIGAILVGLQEIVAVNTILIPKMSFDCNSQVKVKKNFRFSPGAQFINRSLRDDWFVFEENSIEFSTVGYGNKARIAVDNNLLAWNHAVALVKGNKAIRNLTISNVNLVGNYADHSGTALELRADLSNDGGRETDPSNPYKWNSISWGVFNNLSLEYCNIGLSVKAFQPQPSDVGSVSLSDGGSWITSCQFRNLKIASARRGVEIICVPLAAGAYPYNTQIAEIQIDFVQQWMNDSKEAVYIDGAGQNKIEFFAWDYDGYTTKPSDAVIVKGSDGRDNFISGNMALKHVLFSSPENSYQLLYKSKEQNPILHRRICAIRHTGGGNYEIEKSYRIPFGINGVEKDPNDSYSLIVNYDRGFGGFQIPYIICQDTNNTNGYSIQPFYNLSQSSTGKANFYIRKPGGGEVSPLSEVPTGAIFIIEIICV
ncbi:Uncharacterised protein [Morganella morganii]|uniref:tail fiber/spike domain-containing protein n=1 Tax=Morganella morganii TaxID=582 RepID=UPI000789727E|nr:hypothetical protein [Morganella morganii]QXO40150.1 hypothetical protein JL661_05360 [Morganella morganii]WQD68620.1 hypothetical protein U0006_05370 [Morganella morganii]VDY33512.1 Uncharacterised protein [Morganella morganii]